MTTLVLMSLIAGSQAIFKAPERITLTNGIPIDVIGYAAPAFGDVDGDGKRDLIIGWRDLGFHTYLNQGTNQAPVFSEPAVIEVDTDPKRWVMVTRMTPEIVDIDEDGILDIVQGSYTGDLYVNRGKGKGKFHKLEPLQNKDGRGLRAGMCSSVSVADWNGDGKLDLVVFAAVKEGENPVRFYPGLGGLRYGDPVPVEVREAPFRYAKGGGGVYDAGLCVADWDGDGTLDLILGNGDGGVSFYKGTRGGAGIELAPPQTLIEPLGEGYRFKITDQEKLTLENPRSGAAARPIVLDWNGDGKLDLLVGDYLFRELEGTGMSKEDLKHYDEFVKLMNAKEAEFLKKHQEHYEKAKAKAKITDLNTANEEQQKILVRELSQSIRADADYARLERESETLQSEYGLKYAPMLQGVASFTHGFVWLYLRQ